MNIIRLFSLCILIISNRAVSSDIERYQSVRRQLNELAILKDSIFNAANVTLTKDAGTFTFTDGAFYILSRVNNNVSAILFIGNGDFSFVPPTDVEKKQLYRFFEKEELHEHFKYLFLLFTDSTFEEILKNRPSVTTGNPTESHKAIEIAQKYIQNKDQSCYDVDVLRAFLPRSDHNWFYAHLWEKERGSLFFEIDNEEVEEVTLMHRPDAGTAWPSGYVRETVCSFNIQSDYQKKELLNDEYKSTFVPFQYVTDLQFEDDLNAVIRCDIIGKNLRFKTDWLSFTLLEDVTVDSVRSGDGTQVQFIKEKESSTLWIYDPRMFSVVDTLRFTFYYHGKIIKNVDFWRELKSSNGWYPNIFNLGVDRYTFDMTFRHPSKWTLVAAGNRISSQTMDGISMSQWEVSMPTIHASFAIGSFEEYRVDSSLVPITFYSSTKYQHSSLFAGDFRKDMANDLNSSIRFFTHVFGKPPINELKAVEIAGGHGQAFPNLLHLSWYTFQNKRSKEKGTDESFRAHEVAHMWWGLGVSWKSYHDYWLSEAFAEYSGLWYMQVVLRDNKTFFESLESSKKSILGARKYLLASGQQSGPIWLGSRTQSSNTRGDYGLIVYDKGAWVLHMIRNMALDLKTMNEDAFQDILKDFYSTYNGKNASTEDFQRITEKHFKTGMQWFFDQWVYNTDIPKYNIIYKLQKLENGKFKVKCTVRQSNVPENFQMYVPFLIDFGEKRFARVRYLIKGPITEFEFPVLPLKPEEIKFNDLESVLCEIDDEDWD